MKVKWKKIKVDGHEIFVTLTHNSVIITGSLPVELFDKLGKIYELFSSDGVDIYE